MSLRKRVSSVQYALQGLVDLVKSQPNARIHLTVGTFVIAAGFYFRITKTEWLAVLLCISLVLALEAVNTALEYLTDLVSPNHHPLAGKAKDVAAAAVLIAALGAVAIGLMVFGPRILELLR
jgi:diacylglycerol kinase (ATP)